MEIQPILDRGNISEIAKFILKDWKKVNYAAQPYLDAMLKINNINDNYGVETAKSVVLYFLSNAAYYRGENAKLIKKHLNLMIK